jgi:hypothetical protein
MSGDVRDFNIKTRAFIKFFLQGTSKARKEIYAILTETLGEYAPSYDAVKNWVTHFKRGDVAPCPGLTQKADHTTPEVIDKIHELILEYRKPNFG